MIQLVEDNTMSHLDAPTLDRLEREGLLWELKASPAGQALLEILREEVVRATADLVRAQPDDAILVMKLQCVIHTRNNWIRRVESAQRLDNEEDR